MTDQEFTRHALDVLKRELGPDGLARFLRLNRSGTRDYTRDRHQWQEDLTLDQILESIRKHRPR
jgi:hypothetical protein